MLARHRLEISAEGAFDKSDIKQIGTEFAGQLETVSFIAQSASRQRLAGVGRKLSQKIESARKSAGRQHDTARCLQANAGSFAIGQYCSEPPTLLLQYHFDAQGFKPYVGVGINHTLFSGVSLGTGVDTSKSSTGAAWQVGVDVPLSKNMVFNVDLKKTYISTDVYASGTNLGTLKVDPWLLGVGVGWRF